MSVLLAETDDAVATLTLNRPHRRNALSSELLAELHGALERLDADERIRAIVLTGADPAFCAGLDLEELGDAGGSALHVGEGTGARPIPPLATPLIAAVNGPAITGGLELVLLCDIIVASERAIFGDTHARIGLVPEWGATALLPLTVGVRKATEMFLTSRFLDAQEAHRCGLATAVFDHDELLDGAHGIARAIAANDPRMVTELLSILKQTAGRSAEESLAVEAERAHALQGSGIDTDEIARRRETVIGQGRSQL